MIPAQLSPVSYREWTPQEFVRFVNTIHLPKQPSENSSEIFARVTNLLQEQEEEILSLPFGKDILNYIPAEASNPLFYFHREKWLEDYNRLEFMKYKPKGKELDISKASLTRLPCEIGLYSDLELLTIMETPLRMLPPEFGQLTKLKTLMICFTNLRTLPQEFQNLIALEKLDLSRNKLESIEPLASLRNLQHLDVKMNNLSELPKSVEWDKLKILVFRKNKIEKLPSTYVLPALELVS